MISKRYFLVLALALAGMAAKGQNNYVFMYSDYIFGQTTSVSTEFVPNNCIYTGTSGGTFRNGNGYYIVYANNSVSFDQSTGSNLTINNNNYLYYDNTYYLRYSASANNNQGGWQFRNQYNVQAIAYVATTSSVIGSFSISGDATIITTGTNSSYTHTNAEYYDRYSFNSLTYYSTNPSVAASTTMPTSGLPTLSDGYTWSISANSYATVNSATGAITVNSLPTSSTPLTLTCSVTRNGVTQTASMTVTLENPIDPTSITATTPITVYVGTSGAATYTLNPSGAYDNVTGTTSDAGIFTVGAISNGSVIINPVAVGSATLTLTAHKLNGDPITPSAVVTVNVHDICATPTITFTQIGDGATANTTITSTTGADIFYTINGADPTISSTHYTGPFEVNDGEVVRAIAVMTGNEYWDNSAIATKEYHACSTDIPVITYTSANGTANVTITAETGATIYYTTNGDDPTTNSPSGTTSVTINNVANGTVVKAFAKNSTCSASTIVTETIIVSGANGSVVTLNDLEPHSWSYYSDVTNPVRSLNPADVRITYFGNGKMYTSTTATPSGNLSDATGVQVSTTETEHTFVYYKTLERANFNGTGNLPYNLIPNPFSKRPTFTSGGTSYYTGFYGWRVKRLSGVTINGYGVDDIIPAETDIEFVTSNEYNNEVDFEAVWARAFVFTTINDLNSAGNNAYVADVNGEHRAYERNFVVVNANVGNTANNKPATISCLNPDGSGTVATRTGVFTLSADTKFEYINLNNADGTFLANNHYLCFGRGISTGNRAASWVRGFNAGTNATLNYTIRMESGAFTHMTFLYHSPNTNATFSGVVQVKGIMGCDYDRATGNDESLLVGIGENTGTGNNQQHEGLFYSLHAVMTNNGNNNGNIKTFDCVFKSGNYLQYYQTNVLDGAYDHNVYCGQNSSGNTYPGVRYVTVEGGEFPSMNGGRGVGQEDEQYFSPQNLTFLLRIKGGLFHGSVFGGAADNPSIGGRRIVITGGTIHGWVAAGANGTGSVQGSSAQTKGNSFIYVGGNSTIGGANVTVNNTPGGNVFGAGRGNTNQMCSVYVSNVVVADNATIHQSVYGGGFNGYTEQVSNVYVLGGTVNESVYGGGYNHSGSFNNVPKVIPATNVYMTGGTVMNGVYGASNSTGTVGNVTMHIDGGTVGNGETSDGVWGGGYGPSTIVSGNVDVTVGVLDSSEGVTVNGDVYGGSALGSVNGTAATNNYHTNVTLNAGIVNGNVYGGALGDLASLGTGHSNVAANVYGPVTVIVNGGSAENVFGCNNINGAPQRAVDVTVNGGEVMQNVYGGGNVAAYTFARGPVVVINGGTIDQDVYGGGNLANVTGNTWVTVNGGTIVQDVYGGGALADVGTNYNNTTLVDILGGTIQRAVYGGGLGRKAADGVSAIAAVVHGNVTVNIGAGTESNTTLHFSNDATGDATLIGASVFGGNNVNGTPLGNVTVNIWGTAHTDDNVQSNTNGSYAIANVFGGGNESDYKPTLSGAECVVHIYSCANTIQRTFGGGNAAATPTATTTIQGGRFGQVFGGGNGERGPEYGANVGYDDDDNDGDVIVDIHGGLVKEFYGGSNQNGVIQGSINIDVDNESGCGLDADEFFCGGNFVDIIGGLTTTILCSDGMEIANLYGGCNQAEIFGDVVLNVYGGIYTNVFGGSKGRLPETNGPDDEGISADIHGRVFLNLYGGTIENVFGGSNVRGNIDDRIVVNVLDVEGPCPLYITNIYGGSNLTSYTPENATITSPLVNVVHAKYGISGNVFGGSKGLVDIPATVNANPRVNLGYDSDMIDNTNNTYLGTYVNDYPALLQSPRSIVAGSVFGGCDAAQVIGNTAVYLRNRSKVFGNVYGGGNMGEVTGNTLVIVNGANQ